MFPTAKKTKHLRETAMFAVLSILLTLTSVRANQLSTHDNLMSLPEMRIAAERNDISAQTQLGRRLLFTDDDNSNEKEGLLWLERAARAGSVLAKASLAFVQWRGLAGTTKDPQKAFEVLSSLSGSSDFYARFYLAQMLIREEAIKRDPIRGKQILLELAHSKNPSVYMVLGEALSQVQEIRNLSEAKSWLIKAQNEGEVDATCDLAELFEAEGNVRSAIKLYKRAAQQKSVQALHSLMIFLMKNNDSKLVNPQEIIKMTEDAAKGESLNAMTDLGLAYRLGVGVKVSKELAFEWLTKSAEKGDPIAQFNLASMYEVGEGKLGPDHKLAKKWYQEAAKNNFLPAGKILESGESMNGKEWTLNWLKCESEEGDVPSQRRLGLAYLTGDIVQQDYAEASYWLRKASKKDDAEATALLGAMYKEGLGEEQNNPEAMRYFKRASELGNTGAMTQMAELLLNGDNIPANPDEAFRLFERAAASGSNAAQIRLADAYNEAGEVDKAEALYSSVILKENADAAYKLGKILEKRGEMKKSTQLFRASAILGYAPAQKKYGELLDKGIVVKKNIPEAMSWWKKAAEQGNVEAQYFLATTDYNRAHNNITIPPNVHSDPAANDPDDYDPMKLFTDMATAIEDGDSPDDYIRKKSKPLLWKIQSDKGNASAAAQLGWYLQRGSWKNSEESFKFLKLAAERGDSSAQLELGKLFESGGSLLNDDVDIVQDFGKSATWYEKASMQDNHDAQGNLARLYEEGLGVTKDLMKASYWRQKSKEAKETRETKPESKDSGKKEKQ